MNYRSKQKTSSLWLLLECTGMIVLIFGVYLFRVRPFHINNDQMFQYPVFYQEWIRLIRDCFAGRGLPLYSWRMFLGTDFYSAMAYYVTGDVFLPLFFVFDAETALIAETVLCFYIACFAMYGLLRRTGSSCSNARFFSLLYSFGGWGMLYIGQYMFHRFYAFFPLLLLGAELYFRAGKHWPAALAVCLLFVTNYYLMWPASLFLLGYCMVRESERSVTSKQFFRDVLHLLAAYLAGMMLSGAILVPAVCYVLRNPRVGSVTNTGLFWPLKVYAGWLLSFINSPFPVYTGYSNLFRLDDNGYGYWYTMFVTIIPLITGSAWMMKKEHRAWLVFTAVLAVSSWLKPLSVLFHGLSDPSMRWTFLIQMIFLLMSARALEEDEDTAVQRRTATVYGVIVLLSLGVTAGVMGIEKEYWIHYGSIAACIISAAAEWMLYRRGRLKLAKCLALAEVACCSGIMQMSFFHDVVYSDYRLESDEFTYLKDTDNDLLYRIYMPVEDGLPGYPDLNISMRYDFLSTRTYNSLYDTAANPFLSLMGISEHRIDITDPDALDLLGTKYFLIQSDGELPADREYEYVASLEDSLLVYRSVSFSGFGYAGGRVGYFDEIDSVKDMKQGVYVNDRSVSLDRYRDCTYAPFMVSVVTTDYLSGSVVLDHPGILFLPIPYTDGWTLKVDGSPAAVCQVNGGFIGAELESGTHTVELNFMSPGLKAGILLSGAGLLALIGMIFLDHRHTHA